MRRFPISWDKTLTKLGLRRKHSASKSSRYHHRRSRIESLETRALLTTASLAPTVEDVIVSNGVQSRSFYDLEVNQSANQLRNALIDQADTITIEFDSSINPGSVSEESLQIIPLRGDQVITPASASVNGSTATWVLPSALTGDLEQYIIRLEDSVLGADTGLQLDGEWINPKSVGSDTPWTSSFSNGSGDGEAGGDFLFAFNVLMADADLDQDIDGDDLISVTTNYGNNGTFHVAGDADGDNDVDGDDLIAAQTAGFKALSELESLYLLADFNSDGVVTDPGDSAAFESSHEQSLAAADINSDGNWDDTDLAIFQAFVDMDLFDPVYVVNSARDLSDAIPGDGVVDTGAVSGTEEVTLRAALEEISAYTSVLAGAGIMDWEPTISFDESLHGETIELTGGWLTIDSDLRIDGPGADLLTIDAAGAAIGLSISYAEATISGLKVTGATDAGVSSLSSTTRLQGLELTGNGKGVSGGFGALTIRDTTIAENTDWGLLVTSNLSSPLIFSLARFEGGR